MCPAMPPRSHFLQTSSVPVGESQREDPQHGAVLARGSANLGYNPALPRAKTAHSCKGFAAVSSFSSWKRQIGLQFSASTS